jgi:aryl-alcohol dehydrogenase-like predicted oxidoreductase
MEIRILGRDLEVSEIGFGCMGMSHACVYCRGFLFYIKKDTGLVSAAVKGA